MCRRRRRRFCRFVVYEKSFTLRAFGGVLVATLYFETNTNASLSLSLSKTMNE